MTRSAPLILLAEDNAATGEIMREVLEVLGYRVELAVNGRIAVERAFAVAPDLVLMDVQMPEMDGLAATRLLRADPRTAKLPIICLTAFAMAEETKRCLDAGANLHLSKPVEFERLATVLKELCPPAAG
jgi:CheY-like chemotaxis protein